MGTVGNATTRETFWDRWSPEHPVRWTPAGDEPEAWLSVDDAAARIARAVGWDSARAVRELAIGRVFRFTFATYQLVAAVEP